MVESDGNEVLRDADKEDVALLVVGDPFGATTHADLAKRARDNHIVLRTVPNASIMTAVGATGLELYKFGQTVSMVFFTDNWRPASFYDRIKENRSVGQHTLVLLDIKVKEQTVENMMRQRPVYEPPRYMRVGRCVRQMLEIEEERGEGAYGPDSLAIGVARVGSKTEMFVAGTLQELCHVTPPKPDEERNYDELLADNEVFSDEEMELISDADWLLGKPLHSLVLLGKRTELVEHEFVRQFAINQENWDRIWEADYKSK